MDLHPEEAVLSGAEDEEQEHSDPDLQIRRTVTQVGQQLLRLLKSDLGSIELKNNSSNFCPLKRFELPRGL